MFNGERLRELREGRGWSRADLAAVSGVGESHISKLERGLRPSPLAETVYKLEKALDAPPGELMPPGELVGVAVNAMHKESTKPLTRSEYERLLRQIQSIKLQTEKVEEFMRKLRPRFDGDGA